jgi:hypothetical protein
MRQLLFLHVVNYYSLAYASYKMAGKTGYNCSGE